MEPVEFFFSIEISTPLLPQSTVYASSSWIQVEFKLNTDWIWSRPLRIEISTISIDSNIENSITGNVINI